jgi:hypothetical protein
MSDGFFEIYETEREERRKRRTEDIEPLPPLIERLGAFENLNDLKATVKRWGEISHPDELTLDGVGSELERIFVSAGRDPNDPELWGPVYLDYVSRGKFDGHGALGRIFTESKAAEAIRHEQRIADMFAETLGNARTDAKIRKLFGE